jgi:predicted Zn-dependent protease
MEGVWYDGRVAAPRRAVLAIEADALVIAADGEERRWPLQQVQAEAAGDRVRLTGPPGDEGRLMLDAGDWRRLAPEHAAMGRTRARRRELKLVTALAAVGIAGALFVFVGMPAAAGPLAAVTPLAWEERIGRNFESQVGTVFKPCRDGAGAAALARLGETLEAQSQTRLDVRVRAVEAPMVNAFALPGGAVFVTDDLIEAARSPDELAGVVAHEVAHIQERHVMRAVWRSIGAGMLLDLLVGGGGGAGQQAVLLAGSFTEMSYSRELEAEADAQGRALLHAAGLSSQGMASFFQHLANERSNETARRLAEFMGSHPDSARRAARARADERPGRSALTPEEWRAVRVLCTASDNPIDRFRRGRGGDRRAPGGDEVREVGQD